MKEYLTEHSANQYSPLALAFLGDSVYDTMVRSILLKKANMPVSKLHSMKIKLVCAEFQAQVFDFIIPHLNEKELIILKRGRNSTGNTTPKHSNTADYRKATALESLFGFLYITGNLSRIDELFEFIMINFDNIMQNRSEK